MDNGEDISNSIPEIFLEASDDSGQRLFHSIERTMKYDTTRAIFTKQNQDACNKIFNDIDTWLSSNYVTLSPIVFILYQKRKLFNTRIRLVKIISTLCCTKSYRNSNIKNTIIKNQQAKMKRFS
jgi:hypothetical protein